MSLEVCWSVKLSTADITAIRLLSGVDGLVAGEVALVAEGGLAAVTLVGLVAVHLEHVLLQRPVFSELGVALVTEECAVFTAGVGVL